MFSLNTPLYYNYVYKSSDRNGTDETLYRTTQISKEFIGNDVYIYDYDVLGNITSIKKATRSGDTANSTSYTGATAYISYTYDDLGQLTRENNKVNNTTTLWTYDELGNITAKTEYAYTTGTPTTATKTVAYGYGKDGKTGWNNLLTSVDIDGDGVGENDTITYDKIGNPTTYLGATLTWNGRQLTSYTIDDKAITYTYDANGIRASKTVNGSKTQYFYVNGQLHYEERSDGTKLYYFYDSNGYLSGINHNGTNYYPATNLKGDVVAIYRHTGALWATYEYDAWGNVIAVKDASGNAITDETHIALVNPIRYRGYYYDSETGLYYLGSRYYDPSIGRFLNADTIDVLSVSPAELTDKNLFSYCDNNPVTRADSGGEVWHIVAGAAIGGVVGGVVSAISQYATTGEVNWGVVGVNTVSGAISGALASTGIGLVASIGANAALGGTTYVAEQVVKGEAVIVGGVVASTFAGGLGGAIGGKGANVKSLSVAWKTASKGISREIRRENVKYATKQIAKYTAEKAVAKTSAKVAVGRFILGAIGNTISRWKSGY